MELMDHQLKAVEALGDGKILYGGVGSGKSITALAYYMKAHKSRDIVIITTAKKRDTLDWEKEAAGFGIGTERNGTVAGVMTVDSWNNIGKYTDLKNCFFVFDEQRLVGRGSWVKSFLKIAKNNPWILLSATPGDTWLDYAPVFIANGFYKNITDFKRRHVLYEPFVKYPKIRGFIAEHRLWALRNDMLVEMPYIKDTERYLNYIDVGYNQKRFDRVYKDRWNVYEDKPVKDAAELFRVMRRVINEDPERLQTIRKLMGLHSRMIIFYNFNYELDALRTLADDPDFDVDVFEYNGHKKDPVPTGDQWVYLVQYVAGAEGWNCVSTNVVVLYSLTYSYKNFEQAQGRIDRLNTPFKKLLYYILVSNSVVDRAIRRSLGTKETFNVRKFMDELEEFGGLMDDVRDVYQENCEIG